MPCKGFNLTWQGKKLEEVIAMVHEKASYGHNERLLEAETAMSYHIPFNREWYSMPLVTRSTMIAARVGREWIDGLANKEAMERMHG